MREVLEGAGGREGAREELVWLASYCGQRRVPEAAPARLVRPTIPATYIISPRSLASLYYCSLLSQITPCTNLGNLREFVELLVQNYLSLKLKLCQPHSRRGVDKRASSGMPAIRALVRWTGRPAELYPVLRSCKEHQSRSARECGQLL